MLQAGDWTAGEAGESSACGDGAFHGLVMWESATLALFYLLTTAVLAVASYR